MASGSATGKNIFFPTLIESIVYFVIALVPLVTVAADKIVDDGDLSDYDETWLSEKTNELSNLLSENELLQGISDTLLWAGVGVLFFFMASFLKLLITDFISAKKEASNYVKASGASSYTVWRHYSSTTLFHVGGFILFVAYTYFFFRTILPYLVSRYEVALQGSVTWDSILLILGGMLGIMASIHLFTILLREIFSKNRVLD